jgi:putative ABC transport system substrate-binding protein
MAEPAARSIGLELIATRARKDAEFESEIAEIASQPGGGLIVPEAITNARSVLIIELAAGHRLPTVYASRFQVVAGGLMSHGVDLAGSFRDAASYVDRMERTLPQAPTGSCSLSIRDVY